MGNRWGSGSHSPTIAASEFADYVVDLFRRAGFVVTREIELRGVRVDLLVERPEMIRTRKYAIELKYRSTAVGLNEVSQFRGMSASVLSDIDEYWMVAPRFSAAARSLIEGERRLRLFALDELEHALATEAPRRKKTVAARTRVAKAVLLNKNEIETLAGSLVALIDDKLAELTRHRLNDPDSIAAQEVSVSELTKLRAQVQSLAASVADFRKGSVKEKEVLKSVTTFSDGIQAWWADGHKTICSSSFSVALFTTAISISSLAGVSVHGKTATVIAGALAGGKPLVDALKGFGKGLFK